MGSRTSISSLPKLHVRAMWRSPLLHGSRILVASAVLLVGAHASTADASDDTAGKRRMAAALFEKGRALVEAGKGAEACPKFEESHRIFPTGAASLNLGLCYEALGRVASAVAAFEEALGRAIADRRDDRQRLSREKLAELRPRVPKIRILVPPNLPAASVLLLDGEAVPRSLWGDPIPVDPGRHRITLEVPGHAPRATEQPIAEAQVHTLRLSLGDEVRPQASASTSPPALVPFDLVRARAIRERADALRTGGYVSVYAGGVLLVTALSLGLPVLISPKTEPCSESASSSGVPCSSLSSLYDGLRTASYVTLGLGLASLGVAGILFWQSSVTRAKLEVRTAGTSVAVALTF